MSDLQICRAGSADAAGIAHVPVQAWREAYAHLTSPAALAGLNVEDRAARWKTIIDDGVSDVWIAKYDDDDVVGWASASRGRDGGDPRPTELEGIYVLAAHYGSGAGQRLLEAAIGSSPAYLWMAADNPRAAAFYRRNGFVADGASEMHNLAGTSVPIVRMVR